LSQLLLFAGGVLKKDAPRIHGELLMLGFDVAKCTVSKYMLRRRSPPSQSWKAFLRNHAIAIAAIDMCVVPTLTFERLFAVLILGHRRRNLLWFEVTRHPAAEWQAGLPAVAGVAHAETHERVVPNGAERRHVGKLHPVDQPQQEACDMACGHLRQWQAAGLARATHTGAVDENHATFVDPCDRIRDELHPVATVAVDEDNDSGILAQRQQPVLSSDPLPITIRDRRPGRGWPQPEGCRVPAASRPWPDLLLAA
jgi:hypothetical protein